MLYVFIPLFLIEGKRLTNKIALIKWVKNSNNTTE